MSITSFDHFVETLENVPSDLQRNFTLMADLDRRNGELLKRINECVSEYWKTCIKEERMNLLKEFIELFDKAKGYSDDKIDLAMQTYDLVDKHIRRLEGISSCNPISLAKEQNQQHQNSDTTTLTSTSTNSSNPNQNINKKIKQHDKNRNGSHIRNNGNANNRTDNKKHNNSSNDEQFLPTLAIDMPLDPNEPRYCTCHQVSFGEMIACDNKDCPIEWFHFACVDLKSKPKGKWYCPECFNINKKVKNRHKR